MEPSSTKKRRLAALGAYAAPAAAAAQPAAQRQPVTARKQPAAAQPPPSGRRRQPAAAAPGQQQPAAAPAARRPSPVPAPEQQQQQQQQQPAGACDAAQRGAFPYAPLHAVLPDAGGAAAVAALGLPPPGACRGDVADVLGALMAPHMPPHVAASTIAARTIDKSVVLDNPATRLALTRPSGAARARRPRLAGGLLPRGRRGELARLPAALDHAALLPLHEAWGRYVGGVAAGKGDDALARLLPGLDWHGAVARVTRAANPIYVGRAGIVARATANALVLVGPEGRPSTVPLKGAAFEVQLPGRGWTLELAGPSLAKLAVTVVAKP
ncbi:POP4 [Scenedesmus sp. PABB004]|nr:POP4 [Scenedesmus sp. PABB004]